MDLAGDKAATHANESGTPCCDPQFKQNWETFFARMTAWWNGTLDGPIIRIPVADEGGRPKALPDDGNLEAHANDIDMQIRDHEADFRSSRFLTALAPTILAGVGHGLPSFLGCPLEYRRETVWTHPCLNSITDSIDLTQWRTDSRWEVMKQKVRQYTARAARRYGVAYYMGGIMQGMALMRGDEALLIDLMDHPDQVESLRDRLLAQWFEMADELEALLGTDVGRWSLFALWAPGRLVFCECDVSVNFSPEHFRRFVVPEVRAMAQWASYSMYHLDGAGAVHHLDALLEIPELDAIQWIRGDGGGAALDWLDLLHRIQAGGKKLYVECPSSELQRMLNALDPRGLLVTVDPAVDPAKLDDVVRIATQYGAAQDC